MLIASKHLYFTDEYSPSDSNHQSLCISRKLNFTTEVNLPGGVSQTHIEHKSTASYSRT